MGIFGALQSSYSPVESWFYDHVIASRLSQFRRAIHELFVEDLQALPAGAKVLDIGCGGGHSVIELAKAFPQLQFVGLDLSAEQIARAEERARGFGYRVRFFQGSAAALPFESASFDLVMSIGSVKHWPDQDAGLAEAARVLRPGGVLVIAEAVRGSDASVLEASFGELHLPVGTRRLMTETLKRRVFDRSPTADELRSLVARQPLSVPTVHRPGHLPGVVIKAAKPLPS